MFDYMVTSAELSLYISFLSSGAGSLRSLFVPPFNHNQLIYPVWLDEPQTYKMPVRSHPWNITKMSHSKGNSFPVEFSS